LKKRLIISSIVTCIVFIFVYAQPILFPSTLQSRKPAKYPADTTRPMWKSNHLPVSGFAAYIGRPASALPKNLATSSGVQVDKVGKKIVRVRVTSAKTDTAPFKIGERFSSISGNMLFVTVFLIQDKNVRQRVELTDAQLNYSPLVRFVNDSYAILSVSKASGRLTQIDYVSGQQVLHEGPYTIESEEENR
jgi:hypothetical protein